jgi:4-hydroxy-tetrahydrodipicolinate reductase
MGRMGQTIAALLQTRKDLIYHTFDRISTLNQDKLKSCNAVIEFTTSEAAPGVIRHCIEHRIPVTSGTTGWHEYHLESILTLCKQSKGTFLFATNFSIGMNIVFELNRKLADVMDSFPSFKPSIKEIHHIHKKDSPSGTAYTLIEDILVRHHEYSGFVLNPEPGETANNRLPVSAIREGEVKGFHEVNWNSGAEKITIAHEAFDRKIFAEGAIMSALWLTGQGPGIYTMKDIISI